MDEQKKADEGFTGDSDLFKAVRLLEENGFYVVHADLGQHKCGGASTHKDYTGAILIQAYPKRTVIVGVVLIGRCLFKRQAIPGITEPAMAGGIIKLV